MFFYDRMALFFCGGSSGLNSFMAVLRFTFSLVVVFGSKFCFLSFRLVAVVGSIFFLLIMEVVYFSVAAVLD